MDPCPLSNNQSMVLTCLLFIKKVWDVNIIETAMKDFYGDDMNLMIDAIQRNLTVSR